MDMNLKKYATARQWECYSAIESQGDISKAARFLNVQRCTIRKAKNSILKKAAASGYSPDHDMTHEVPNGFQVSGVSTNYDEQGNIRQQWVKSSSSKEQDQEALLSLVEGLNIPKFKPIKCPKTLNSDLLNAYIFGDLHLNMLSHHLETGKNWCLDIALEQHNAAMMDMIDRSPKADTGLLCTLGDMFHQDSLKAQTAGGTQVDVDGRIGKAMDKAVLLIRMMIDKMLKKYQLVQYVCVRGNHSETLELAFAKMMIIAYENEPRVEVLDNTSKHMPLSFGKNFILFTHGDKLNDQKKADIVVSKYRKEHGAANFSHVVSGHVHHASQKELSGVLSETFQALPTPDAWHHESGFVTADQAASVVTYHKLGGICERTITNPRIFLK